MARINRRQLTRFEMEIPLSIRVVELPETQARMGVSSNISASGLYLSTDLQLRVGAAVEISMRMPELVTGKPSSEWRCRGRVVRVEAKGQSDAEACVGIEFQYYEVMDGPAARFGN
jgi:PilZ domain-containing protein